MKRNDAIFEPEGKNSTKKRDPKDFDKIVFEGVREGGRGREEERKVRIHNLENLSKKRKKNHPPSPPHCPRFSAIQLNDFG